MRNVTRKDQYHWLDIFKNQLILPPKNFELLGLQY